MAEARGPETEASLERIIAFTLNGKATRIVVDEDRTLLWVLRGDLGLTGTKFGCGAAMCGVCTVIVDGEAVRSCTTAMKEIAGKNVLTIEGLGTEGKLHPIQDAYVRHGAFQCGYCTPGMILTTYAFLRKTPHPSREQIIDALDGNLCRCGAHLRIVEAVQEAAAAMNGGREMTASDFTRRDFLATGTGLFVFLPAFAQEPARLPTRMGYPTDFNAWMRIGADGRVTCFVGKVELGQGAMTELAMCLAEELDVAFDSVDMVMGDTDLCPWDMGTFGSMTTPFYVPVLRACAAEARAVLLGMAADRLHAPVDRLKVSAGTVIDTASGKQVTYSQLVEGQRIEHHIDKIPGSLLRRSA